VLEKNEIAFRVAQGPEIEAALQAREPVYHTTFGHNVDDGYDRPGTHLIAANAAGEVLGGVRVLGPELRPFDFEHIFDLTDHVSRGRRPAMLGRLFLREDHRAVSRSAPLLQGLLDLSVEYARSHQITDYYMYTFSHLLRFYAHAGFRSLGITIYHEHWRTLHLMHMDVAAAFAPTQ
jgi:predicted GNAT family N-acyltransferase